MAPKTDTQKQSGAYYTPEAVAAWLSEWALRSPSDRAMDPSHGDGVFLIAAAKRLQALGGSPASQLYGCELSPEAHGETCQALGEFGISAAHLYSKDFFLLSPNSRNRVDAQIGNPPYIRYQRFSGEARKRALEAALSAGVKLNQLASAWAPFLVHACEFLKPGGRLAMVLPFEITYANYARPVLEYLRRSFASLRILTFQRRLFQDLSEDTVLLLADGYGQPARHFSVQGYLDLEALLKGQPLTETQIKEEEWNKGDFRLSTALLPLEIQKIYRELSQRRELSRLGAIAAIDIGYVSGNNAYFHLSEETLGRFAIPKASRRPTIVNSRDLSGLSYTLEDFNSALALGKPAWLFYPDPSKLSRAEKAYILQGEKDGVPKAYKCRTRTPWWRVPFAGPCDAVLTVMSNLAPRMVSNDLGARVANSLLTLRFQESLDTRQKLLQVAAFYTSLSHLSAELEGHSLGGGALKLEPGEAKQLLLPRAHSLASVRDDHLAEIDRVLRQGHLEEAVALGDMYLLQGALGFSTAEIAQIRKGVAWMRQRRRGK